jgi:trigger factor
MKVTQEKLPKSQIGIDIEIPPEKSKTAYEQVIRNYARNANIPGFRKGKVPRHILIQRLGAERIKAAALDELMQECLPKAVEQENIEAIGSFELRGDVDKLVEQFQPGQPITIQAAVDVKPEVTLGGYTGWVLQAEEVAYDPEKVEKVLEQERAKLATLIPIEDRPAQEGDVAFIDFIGHFADVPEGEEPEEIPGGKGENFQVEITEGQFIPGFTEGIVGMNPGETKELNLSFPEDYGNEELAGKAAVFTMTLNELKEKELPELDDDFAEEISDFETMAELRESLEKRYQEEAEEKTRANKEKALAKALVEVMEIELPETMIRQEVDQILTQQAMQLSQMGIDVKQFFTGDMVTKMRENARPEAVEQLKRSLALQQVAKLELIAVDEEEIKAEEAKIREQLKDQEVDPDRLREVVENDLINKKTFAWLEEHSTVELVPEGTLSESEDKADEDDKSESEVSAETATVDVEAVDSTEEE